MRSAAPVVVVLLIAGLIAACEAARPDELPPTPEGMTATPAIPVVPPTRAVAQLTLTLEPIPVRQGGRVNVSGRGFAAGENVTISAAKSAGGTDMLELGGAAAGPLGTLDGVVLTLPEELASGPHAIEALGHTSGRRSNGTLWIRARDPWLVLSAYEVQPLADLGLIAGGFEPQDSVRVSLEQRADQPMGVEPVVLVELPTDQAGNGEWAEVKLPLSRAGGYSIVLRGQSGGQELRRDIQVVSLKPSAELSPWAGPPGVPLQLNARGFAPNERVHVAFGGPSVEAAVLQADKDGSLWGAGPVRVPATALRGPLVVLLTGEDSGAIARPEFSVLEIKPWLELTTWWGAPGVQVGFGGGGWIGGERVTLHVASASAPALAGAQADDYGWLHVSSMASVPPDADSDVTFVALGEQSHATAKATYRVVFPFDLHPQR